MATALARTCRRTHVGKVLATDSQGGEVMRDFYQNLTSPSYERYFFPTSSGGSITYGIRIYRATDGKDGWHIKKSSYYTSDLKAAKEGRNDWLKYLGKAELDADICDLIFSKVKELKKDGK